MARLDAWLGTPRRRGSDQPHTEPEDVVSEMEAQARICPTCHDDHRETQPCTLPAELDGEVVAVVQAAVKAAVRNIPGHVSDRAAEGIARAALHAFTPRLAVLLREAEARGAARGDATPGVTEWGVRITDRDGERAVTHGPIPRELAESSRRAWAEWGAEHRATLVTREAFATEWREVQP
jgi:hypothetical protein